MLSASALKELVLLKIEAQGFKRTKENEVFIKSLAEAFIEHITTAGVVNTSVTTPQGLGTGIGKIS
ncbi:hypothetical protein BKH43_03850 [Helicobacter sp. 13S00401-1]|uniref:hypothetical protein n=1 Tax=Helicobacter sp. 13S00401-1 TaxID=1905758 RepID=UPI000BA7AF5D|nr:hypothetical protein [Helicobacter sp. 13S00401-1]PAF50706.1 hypothetical protein BKH43_03850 [Helicobacter sp. 13S00401-1]